METIGDRFRTSRLALGLSARGVKRAMRRAGQKKYADGSAVGRYEREQTKPSVEYVRAYCEALDVNPAWLLSGVGRRQWDREGDDKSGRLAAASWLDDFAVWLRDDARHSETPTVDTLDIDTLSDIDDVDDVDDGDDEDDTSQQQGTR